MAETVFDTLVQGMSREERMQMLQKIQTNPGLDPDPIFDHDVEPGEIDLNAEYSRLSLWHKFVLFLRKLFTGKNHFELVEQMLLARLGKRILASNPGLVDSGGDYLLEGFAQRVDDLRGYVQRLAGPLSIVLGDSRRQFVTFMFSMIAPTTYELLRQETDPSAVASANPEFSDRDIKKRLQRSFQDIMESVQSDQRNQVYMNYRFLYHLLQIASFPYTQILQEFQAAGGKLVPAGFKGIEGVLRRLDSQIHSTTETPSSDVLHLVFVFLEQEVKDPDQQSEHLTHQLNQASEAVSALRSFAREVPLRDIIAFCGGDIRYAPLELSGGEDWFTLLRDHIGDIIDRQVDAYVFSRRRKDIVSQLLKISGASAFPSVPPYSSEPLYASCRHQFSLSAAAFIARRLFPDRWLSPLKILLINGEFYKDANREEYNEAYQLIDSLDERIQALLSGLPKTSKNKPGEIQGFLSNADRQAAQLVEDMRTALGTLCSVIDGILFGEVGGRFDTIANLGQINGRNNQRYLKQLENVLTEMGIVRDLLSEAAELERTKKRL